MYCNLNVMEFLPAAVFSTVVEAYTQNDHRLFQNKNINFSSSFIFYDNIGRK